MFDINDFDETLPGPFEWDVKRLAASFVVADRENGFSKKQYRKATLAAVERHLMPDGFVLRHDPRAVSDEQPPIEGAFLACTLWLADAYVLSGDIERAEMLLKRVAGVANDLGLLSEEYDTVARLMTGNFPQALTHIALVNTIHNLNAARKPAMQRARA